MGENGILGNKYLIEFEKMVEKIHLELNSSPFYKATPKRYIHPGFFKVAMRIRKSGVDIERQMKKCDKHKTGLIKREQLRSIYEMLQVDLTERELTGMQDELDPFYTGKVSIKDIQGFFQDDLLIFKLAMMSKPNDIVNIIRDAIFPDKAYKLHRILVELSESDYISEEKFLKAFSDVDAQIKPETLIAIFKIFSNKMERISITQFIKQIYVPKYVADFDTVDRFLLALKMNFIKQRMGYDEMFKEAGLTLRCIGVEEFIKKVKYMEVHDKGLVKDFIKRYRNSEIINDNLVKAAQFLAWQEPGAKSDGIFLSHFVKHMNRLPNMSEFTPRSDLSDEVLYPFLEERIMKHPGKFQKILDEVSDSSCFIFPSKMRLILATHFGIPSDSGIADIFIKKVMENDRKTPRETIDKITALLKTFSSTAVSSSRASELSEEDMPQFIELGCETYTEALNRSLFEYMANILNSMERSLSYLFNELDEDGSGLLDKAEFEVFLEKIGYSLTNEEVDTLLHAIDDNFDGTLSFKELQSKLIKFGYKEPISRGVYTHKWSDKGIQTFFTAYNRQRTTGFEDFHKLFKHFDINKDQLLSINEVKLACERVSKMREAQMERLIHVIQINMAGKKLEIPQLVTCMSRIERDFARGFKPKLYIYEDLFLQVFKRLDQIHQFKSHLQSLIRLAQQPQTEKLRGMLIMAQQRRLKLCTKKMKKLKSEFNVLSRRTTQSALQRIYNSARQEFIGKELAQRPKKEKEFDEYDIFQIPSSDFKIDWDSIFCVNDDLRCYTALYFKDSENIDIEIFSPQLLKKVGEDDVKLEHHLRNTI